MFIRCSKPDITDIFKCCNDNCKIPLKYCYDYSSKKGVNSETCDNELNLCLETCTLVDKNMGKENLVEKCIKEQKCIKLNGYIEKDCVIENKDEIYNCCKRNCIPRYDLDCQKYCEYMTKYYGEDNNDKKLNNYKNFRIKKNVNKNILRFLILGFLILGFLYIKLQKIL